MALATQCPHCQTTFRVANDQLKLRAGLVRCGACREVFNGIEYLVRPVSTEASVETVGSMPSAPLTAPVILQPPHIQTPALVALSLANSATVPEKNIAALLISASEVSATPISNVVAEAEAKKAALIAALDAAAETAAVAAATQASAAAATEEPRKPKVWQRAFQAKTALPDIPHEDDDGDGGDGDQAEEDPLLRMTLFQVAAPTSVDANTTASHEQNSAEATTAEEDDELDRLIDELQNRPWRQSQKFDHVDIEKSSANSASTYVPSSTPHIIYGESRPNYQFSATTSPKTTDDVEDTRGNAIEKSAAEEPEFIQQGKRKQRFGGKIGTAMLAGSALLLLAGIGQTGFVLRDQLAAHLPALKPALIKMCLPLHCKIGLPMKIDAIVIESNELQALTSDTHTDNHQFALNLFMRNIGSTVVAWPNVELTLKDVNEKAQVRRVFTPHDYLPATASNDAGFARNTEQTVKLSFELHQLIASGYSVYLFYP